MGNAESGIAFSEDFIGQVNSMAAAMSEEGSIPITSLKPLVEVLKSIGQSVRNIEETCSRLENEMAVLKEQQLITDKRVELQGFSLQEALKAGVLHVPAPADDADSFTEEPAQHKETASEEQKDTKYEAAGEEVDANVEEEKAEETELQNKKSKEKRRGRGQTTLEAATESETDNSSKTNDNGRECEENVNSLLTPKSFSCQTLFDAAGAGRTNELKVLLDAGLDPNMNTREGSALHRAASEGHLQCVSLLLKGGAHPDIPDILGRSPLHFATLHGHIDCMTELMNHGASLTSRERSGQVPLHYAAKGGHEKAVKELLKRGSEVDIDDSFGQTPLHLAVVYGQPHSTKALLEAGARRTDSKGQSLMSSASSDEVKQLLGLLTDVPPGVGSRGITIFTISPKKKEHK